MNSSNKFFGAIGFGISTETDQDVWQEVITERESRGEVKKDTLYVEASGAQVNSDVRLGNLISIIANPFVLENYSNIRYVLWRGVRWSVTNVTVESPRLVLRLGGVYNGPEPAGNP